MNSYWLIYWENETFGPGKDGLYMGVYAALGVLVAIFTFLMGAATGFLSYWACKSLHYDALQRLMYTPMKWYNVTPIGRIMNRLQKDIDVLDNQLADSFRMLSEYLWLRVQFHSSSSLRPDLTRSIDKKTQAGRKSIGSKE